MLVFVNEFLRTFMNASFHLLYHSATLFSSFRSQKTFRMSEPPTDNATTSVPRDGGISHLESSWAAAIPIGIFLVLACYFRLPCKLLRRMRDLLCLLLLVQRERRTSRSESREMELPSSQAAADDQPLVDEEDTTSFTGEGTVQHRLSQ